MFMEKNGVNIFIDVFKNIIDGKRQIFITKGSI